MKHLAFANVFLNLATQYLLFLRVGDKNLVTQANLIYVCAGAIGDDYAHALVHSYIIRAQCWSPTISWYLCRVKTVSGQLIPYLTLVFVTLTDAEHD